jgi:hypothetical protein
LSILREILVEMSERLEGVRKRRGTNVAAVALANKDARALWALLHLTLARYETGERCPPLR